MLIICPDILFDLPDLGFHCGRQSEGQPSLYHLKRESHPHSVDLKSVERILLSAV